MKGKRFSDEQIIGVLREQESGATTAPMPCTAAVAATSR